MPVVLYQGPEAWAASTRFLDLVDLPADLLEVVREHLPDFRFVLDDLSLQADQEIRARTRHPLAALALLLLKHARDQRDAFLTALREAADLLRQVEDKGDLLLTSSYILVVGQVTVREIEATLGEAVTPQVREAVMTAAERLIEQGRLQERLDMLKVLLETRFGVLNEWVTQRLQRATGEELTSWLTRFANAKSLDEVFETE